MSFPRTASPCTMESLCYAHPYPGVPVQATTDPMSLHRPDHAHPVPQSLLHQPSNLSLPRLSHSGSSQGERHGNSTHQLPVYHKVEPGKMMSQCGVTVPSPSQEAAKWQISLEVSAHIRRIRKENCTLTPPGGSTNGSSDSEPGARTRCRVPLSVLSSPRSHRQTSRYREAERPSPVVCEAGTSGVLVTQQRDGGSASGPPPVPPRRAGTHDGLHSNRSSSGSRGPSTGPSTPVSLRKRRVGRSSLAATNDVMCQVRADLNTWRTSAGQDGTLGAPAGTGNEAVRNSSIPDVFSRLHNDAQTFNSHSDAQRQPSTRPQDQRDPGSRLQHAGAVNSKLTRTKRALLLPQTGNNKDNEISKQENPPANDSCTAEGPPVLVQQEDPWNGMAPDTYDRCVQWVKEVASAKGSRSLATILPPVHPEGGHSVHF